MSKSLPHNRQLWLGIALSLVCLALAVRGLALADILAGLQSTNLTLAGLALLAGMGSLLPRTLRWQLLFHPDRNRFPLGDLGVILLVGQTINVLAFARLGDLVRAYLAGELGRDTPARALGTIAVEKLVDLTAVVVLFLGLIPFLTVPAFVHQRGISLGLITLLLLTGLALITSRPTLVLNRVRRLTAQLPAAIGGRALRLVEGGLQGLTALRQPSVTRAVIALTVIVWCLYGLSNYLLLLAVGLAGSWPVALFLLVVLQIGIAIPSSPGRIGVMHYLAVLALGLVGIDQGPALTFAIVIHLISIVIPTLIGVAALVWTAIRWPGWRTAAGGAKWV